MASVGTTLFRGTPNYPQTCIVLRIFITVPVLVTEGEQSFNKLAIVKNHLQLTMEEDQLSSLVKV